MNAYMEGTRLVGQITSNKRTLKFTAEYGELLDLGWPIQYKLDDGFIKRMQNSLDKGIEKFCIDMGGSEEVKLKEMLDIALIAKGISRKENRNGNQS